MLMETRHTWKTVETGVETQNLAYSVVPHYGKMHAVTRGKMLLRQNDLLGTFHDRLVDRQHLINNAKQCVKCRLNCFSPIYGDVSVQNFLKHLGIGDEPLSIGDQFLN